MSASGKGEKKRAQNSLKFFVAAYDIILRISAKNGPQILKDEAFMADFGLGGATSAYGKERWCLGMGRPSTLLPWHGQAKRAFWPWPCNVPLAWAGQACVGALAWAGQACVGALAWAAQACWCLGVGRPRAHSGLGGATSAYGKVKKKKVAQNLSKFCMAAHNIILRISGEDRFKII